jgi:hypothetical protein
MMDRINTYRPCVPIASRMAGLFWIGLLALCPVFAEAATPEQTYLAARDAQIRKLAAVLKKFGIEDKRVTKQHEQAVADLGKQVARVVGPSALALPGLPADGKPNNDALIKGDMGFGLLDGVRYGAGDSDTMVVVTTEGLFKTWLREHRKWWRDNNVPQDPAEALRHDSFYTQAMSTDAAVHRFAELPVKKPAAASLVFAMVGTRAQDIGSREADEVTLALLQGAKLYLVRAKAGAKLGPFPPCNEIWTKAEQKSKAEFERHQANPNARTPSRQSSIEDEADKAFRRCFAERAPRDKGFANLVQQAQDIIDKLPAK